MDERCSNKAYKGRAAGGRCFVGTFAAEKGLMSLLTGCRAV